MGQMWAFADKKGRPCCLIPEATALFQERSAELLGRRLERPLFYIARCYRYERPQAGRYREFTQLGFELLSRTRPPPPAAAKLWLPVSWMRWACATRPMAWRKEA